MIEVLHCDALDLDPARIAECDALISDPPYSEHVHENCASMRTGGVGAVPRDLGFGPLTPELRGFIMLAASCVQRWSVVFSDFEGAHAWCTDADANGLEYIRTIPWIRWSQPQLSGDRPCTGAEAVLVFHTQLIGPRGGRTPIKKWWNGSGSLTHFDRRALRGEYKHPTEKPLDLMLDIVSAFSAPGERVFDPCAGAGTTALACRLLGRSALVCEIQADWARQARSRVTGPLSDRDRVRAQEWCLSVADEAQLVPKPEDESELKTWERAQRRLADVTTVMGHL